MKQITRFLLLLTLTLGLVFSWSYSAHAATPPDSEPDQPDMSPALHAVLGGYYQLIDGELVEVEELEIDKVYFISATLQNVADQTIDYWTPDQKYNDELYNIWFQFKLPTTFSHDVPGQVVLETSASRRNYDDRWNTSDATLAVYAQAGADLALEFAPGYCDVDTLCQINSYTYYMRSENDCTFVHGLHDSKNPIRPGAERKILLAVRTRDAQTFAVKRRIEKVSHLQVSFVANLKRQVNFYAFKALPVVGDVTDLSSTVNSTLVRPELGIQKRLTVQAKLPAWLAQQSNDQWWLQTKGKAYTEDGNVCFWAGLYNHEVIYDLNSATVQNTFGLKTLMHLDSVEAWYFDEVGQRVAFELSEIMPLPEPSTLSDPGIIPENNGLAAKIMLDGDLASWLAGKTIYLSYSYSQINVAR